jgi:hypothetical protein
MVPPPQKELDILHDLARRGNMRAIQKHAMHIEMLGEQYILFARKLSELAKGFEEDQILAFVEQFISPDK